MKHFVLLTNVISPHQLPLAKDLAVRVGDDNFRYIYTEVADKDHGGLGWSLDVPDWCIYASDADANEWLENADTLLSGLRYFDLFERRAKKGLKNFYMTERWFKPPIGMLRLLHPRYFGYAKQLCRLLESGAVVGFPIGIHAARDIARLCGLVHGDLRCFFKAPELEFEKKPGGHIWLKNEPRNTRNTLKFCLDRMRMWGYFVEPSKFTDQNLKTANADDNSKLTTPNSKVRTLRVLWVGRLLKLKRVDTIIRAVGELSRSNTFLYPTPTRNANSLPSNSNLQLSLDIYGTGPEENRLKKLASKYGNVINFHPPVPITEVRKLMRSHDVYVLASNAYEGWGAVVSEALEEGMRGLGSYEAGSSATMLPEECLFHSGDWRRLLGMLERCATEPHMGIGNWTARNAAELIYQT